MANTIKKKKKMINQEDNVMRYHVEGPSHRGKEVEMS